jgi:chromosome partitioning protein
MASTAASNGARVIALANQKGGVAKTTSVASLGAAFAEQGRRVLLVDLDPQACLTFSLGVDPEVVEASIHEVLTGTATLEETVIRCADGFDLVPAVLDLAAAEARQQSQPGPGVLQRAALEASRAA